MSPAGACAIVGIGETEVGRLAHRTTTGLALEAMRKAILDAGLRLDEVDGVIADQPNNAPYRSYALALARGLGIAPRYADDVGLGGASPAGSVARAVLAIASGLCDVVVCVHAQKQATGRSEPRRGRLLNGLEDYEEPFGAGDAVVEHAVVASRHMHEYGTTREHLGAVAISFREHALRNPEAVMKKPLTLDDYLSARMIAEPYGLFDCSLVSDGAGATVVTTLDRARHLRRPPVAIKGFGTFNNLRGWLADDHMIRTAAEGSGKTAFAMAGITPADVDTAQIYDCFTGMVIKQLEDYGFCKKGEGGPFAASGALKLGGALPTNTAGGQLSEAHVEGMLQIVEGVRQLRHEYPPERQVPNAEIALVSGHGGNTVCHSTLILGRAA